MAEIDDLRARMTALEDLVKDLRIELANSLAGRFRSMRDSRRCPACGGDRLLHIPEARELTEGGASPLSVVHQDRWWGHKPRGPIEYFVCRACLLVEEHAVNLDGIEPDGKAVIAIDPDPDRPPDGPYR